MSKPKSFNLADLEKILDATLVGDPDRVVDNIATISNSNDTSISFITNNIGWKIDRSFGTQTTLEDFFS